MPRKMCCNSGLIVKSRIVKGQEIGISNLSGFKIFFSEKYDIDVNSNKIENRKVDTIIFSLKICLENRQHE
jgi:hypothetical protein